MTKWAPSRRRSDPLRGAYHQPPAEDKGNNYEIWLSSSPLAGDPVSGGSRRGDLISSPDGCRPLRPDLPDLGVDLARDKGRPGRVLARLRGRLLGRDAHLERAHGDPVLNDATHDVALKCVLDRERDAER